MNTNHAGIRAGRGRGRGYGRPSRSRTGTARDRVTQRGVSLLIILALLACMAIIVAANSTALAMLKHEILRIDAQQRQRYGQSPGH